MNARVTQNRPAHVLIDSAAYQHNLAQVTRRASRAKVMAVIKADGYGHGMETAARALHEADEFGVNSFDDMQRLRAAGINKTLSLLSAHYSLDELASLRGAKVRPVCYDATQLDLFEALEADANLSVWLKVDTGMGRLGFSPDQLAGVVQRLSKCKGVKQISLMSHLACADQPADAANLKQIALFESLQGVYPFAEVSLLNSAGVVNFGESAATIVRPGMMLYGVSPSSGHTAQDLALRPVMSFNSQIISLKLLPKGHAIGYGGTHVLAKDTQVGVIAVGYGDGYPRHAKTGTPVLVNNQLAPLLGRVSMDMICVDLSGVRDAKVGTVVTLWGPGNPVEEVARAASTIAYELTCGVLPRVQRIII